MATCPPVSESRPSSMFSPRTKPCKLVIKTKEFYKLYMGDLTGPITKLLRITQSERVKEAPDIQLIAVHAIKIKSKLVTSNSGTCISS